MRNLALQGYQVLASWNTVRSDASFNAIAGGSQDATFNAAAAYSEQAALDSAASGGGIWMCFNHEIENDGGISDVSWRGASSRFYGIFRNAAPHVTTYYATLGGYYHHQWTTDPGLWWPQPNQPDQFGADYYDWRGASATGTGPQPGHYAQNNNRRPPSDLEQPPGVSLGADAGGSEPALPSLVIDPPNINSYMEVAEYFGVPLCFPEFGWAITPQTTTLLQPWITGRRERIQAFADYWRDDPRITMLVHFELDEGGYNDPFIGNVAPRARVNWRLSGGVIPADPATAIAFDSLSTGTTTPPPSSLLTNLGHMFTDIDGTSFTTPITALLAKPTFLSVETAQTTPSNVPTMSASHGTSWTLLGSVESNAGGTGVVRRASVFYGQPTASSAAFVVNTAALATGFSVTVDQWDPAEVDASNIVVNTTTSILNSFGLQAFDMDAPIDPLNHQFLFVALNNNSGLTENASDQWLLGNVSSHGAPDGAHLSTLTTFRDIAELQISFNITGTINHQYAAIAIEVRSPTLAPSTAASGWGIVES
jgi:hypothetical protein